MDILIHPGTLRGDVKAIPSKSHAHRVLICAAFADKPTRIYCPQRNRDIDATIDCLVALGAKIETDSAGISVNPITEFPKSATLDCCESGSTLRFLLPIVGAMGVDATFLLAGRLPERPLSPLWEEMERMGCTLSRPTPTTVRCQGKLKPGKYSIAGNVSSQFITGLLFALPLIQGDYELEITGKLESAPYVDLTAAVLNDFGGIFPFRSPGTVTVEGDWSNAAFFITAKSLGGSVAVSGLNRNSMQGDRAIEEHLTALSKGFSTISAAHIPDLVPIMAVCAACNQGGRFTDIARLRIKESDRVASVCNMLNALGAETEATEKELTVYPASFHGGTVDSAGDHRIAMASAIAATRASSDVLILGADCVSKSYPTFWEEYRRLGGHYEQYVR